MTARHFRTNISTANQWQFPLKGLLLAFLLWFGYLPLAAQPNPTENGDPNYALAHLLFEKNEYAKAEVLFEDLVDVYPTDENTQQRYLQCLVKLGEQDKAIKWIKKKIKKSPQPLSWVIDECWVNTTYPEGPEKPKHTQKTSPQKQEQITGGWLETRSPSYIFYISAVRTAEL